MQPRNQALIRYLGELFIAFVGVICVVGFIIGLTLYATGAQMLLSVFVGSSYLFFILVGSSLGYVVGTQAS